MMRKTTGELTNIRSNVSPVKKSFDKMRNAPPFPMRTGIAAIALFTVGSILIYIGHEIGLDKERRGLSLFILGLITFIPGSYATVQLYGAYKGWKGYTYDYIPSYDD